MTDREPIAMGHSYAEAYGYLAEAVRSALAAEGNAVIIRQFLIKTLERADWIANGRPGKCMVCNGLGSIHGNVCHRCLGGGRENTQPIREPSGHTTAGTPITGPLPEHRRIPR